eukprot:COSAG06_NODE_1099_length_10711_cov_145.571711_7_plen_93_part_00
MNQQRTQKKRFDQHGEVRRSKTQNASKSKKFPKQKHSFASKSSRNKSKKCARVQEKADISPDRIARLNELGFVWDAVAQVPIICFGLGFIRH